MRFYLEKEKTTLITDMSRGLGKVQSAILGTMADFDGEVQQNQLLWHLAELNAKINRAGLIYDNIYEGTIDNSYKNSFLRAVEHLAENGKIDRIDRYINTWQGLLRYYPFKTFHLEIHYLRILLLPIITEYLEDDFEYCRSPGSLAKYGITDHELYIRDNIKSSRPVFYNRLKARWIDIESEILRLPSITTLPNNELWIRLIIKGREFLFDEKLTYRTSFERLVATLSTKKHAMAEDEKTLLDKIEHFKHRMFRESDLQRAFLKTQLYRIASLSKGGSSALRKDVKIFMVEKCPALIKALPGHIDPHPLFRGMGRYEHATFSEILNKLIDRHIYSPFRFLSLK